MLEVPMGMEISSRRLQEADSRMQAEREGADRPVDDRDKERFDRAMQESQERDGQSGQEMVGAVPGRMPCRRRRCWTAFSAAVCRTCRRAPHKQLRLPGMWMPS